MDAKHDHAHELAAFKSFQTTRWSLIFAARDGDAAGGREALAALCGAYWYPLYAFVRRKGYDAETAQDLVQGFLRDCSRKATWYRSIAAKGSFDRS